MIDAVYLRIILFSLSQLFIWIQTIIHTLDKRSASFLSLSIFISKITYKALDSRFLFQLLRLLQPVEPRRIGAAAWSRDLNGRLLARLADIETRFLLSGRAEILPPGATSFGNWKIYLPSKKVNSIHQCCSEGFFREAAYDRYVWFIACAPRFTAFYYGRADEIKYLTISSFPHSIHSLFTAGCLLCRF